MSSVLFSLPAAPVATASTATSPSASSANAARGRDGTAADADGFGAALARTRDTRTRQPGDKADGTADSGTAAPATRRRGASATAESEQKATPADLLAMAMLTPAFNTQAAQKLRGGTASEGAAQAAIDAKAALPDPALEGVATQVASAAGAQDAQAAADAAPADGKPRATAARSRDDKGAKAADDGGKAAKADALALPDTKPAASTAPASNAASTTAAAPATAAPPSAGSDAKPVTSGASAKSAAVDLKAAAPEARQAALHAEEPALGDHGDPKADAATLPAAMAFKTALAQATDGSATTQQAQSLPRYDVSTQVGAEGWGSDIGAQMIRMNTDGKQVAELNLNPAGLGPLKVTLTLGDNQAQAMFVSAHESVRRAVEAALPQLRDTLANQGIQLGQASVDTGAQQQQQAFGQDPRGFDAPASRANAGLRAGPAAQGVADAAAPSPAARQPRSAIDTFA